MARRGRRRGPKRQRKHKRRGGHRGGKRRAGNPSMLGNIYPYGLSGAV
jgi:hypothetical protein